MNMKTRHNNKNLCSERHLAGKFKFKVKRVTHILCKGIICCIALITCYHVIDNSQSTVRAQKKLSITKTIREMRTTVYIPQYEVKPQAITISKEEVITEEIEYDEPEQLQDVFSKNEIEIFERLVEAEATSGGLKEKMNVANVVLNRLESNKFPDTMKDVVFQKTGNTYQFSCIYDKRYYNVNVTKETKKAVRKAFEEKDTTNGALFFCNKQDVNNLSYLKWFNSLQYVKTDSIGHSFYK